VPKTHPSTFFDFESSITFRLIFCEILKTSR
jgi:hypothetical protein